MSKILFALTLVFFSIQVLYLIVNSIAQVRDDGDKILTAKNFIDVRGAASRFITCLRLKAFNTGVAFLMMSVILNHKITIKSTITILNESIFNNIKYLALIVPVLVGMALVGTMVFGRYIIEYTKFDKAFIAAMLYTLGRIEPAKTTKYDSVTSVIFHVVFYLMSVFLTFTVFIGFGLQIYSSVLKKQGYYMPSLNSTNFQSKPL